MAPKRNASDLKLKSIWDENLVTAVMDNEKHRTRMWLWLIAHPDKDLCDIPFKTWLVKKSSQEAILQNFVKFTTKIVERNESSRGDTTKLLIELQDGHRIETVIMRHVSHSTVCVSSQIGCQMGCRFCATGTMGIIGNLTSGEILEQLVYANSVSKIRNVVFMGMGEPLNNYDNLKLSIEFMIDCNRFGLSSKHVTVSTVGVLKSMRRLSDEMPYINLAVSLHAPNQEVRLKIVPAASAHNFTKLMEAVDYHILANRGAYVARKMKRHGIAPTEQEIDDAILRSGGWRPNKITGVMIEYILIKDINDQECHALELAALLATRREHIILSLIPYNPTAVAEDYEPPTEESVNRFHAICIGKPYEIHTRVRQEKGQDIAGACGQLALVNPGNANKTGDEGRDIEDAAGNRGSKKTKPAVRGKKERSEAEGSAEASVQSVSGASSWVSTVVADVKANRSKVLCYANIAAVPLLVASMWLVKQ